MRRLNQVTPTLGRPKFQGTCSITYNFTTASLQTVAQPLLPLISHCLLLCFPISNSQDLNPSTEGRLQKRLYHLKLPKQLLCFMHRRQNHHTPHMLWKRFHTHERSPSTRAHCHRSTSWPLICCRWLPLIRVVSLITHARISGWAKQKSFPNFCWCPSWDLHYFHLFLTFQLLSPPRSRRTWIHGTQSLPATSTTRIFHKDPMWRFNVLWSPVSMKKVQVGQHLKRGRLLLMTT